jgi:hypothetical protein
MAQENSGAQEKDQMGHSSIKVTVRDLEVIKSSP